MVQHLSGNCCPVQIHDLLKDLLQITLLDHEINLRNQLIARHGTIYIAQILRDHFVKNKPAKCALDYSGNIISLCVFAIAAHLDS